MEILRKLRKERGLTLDEISSSIGVTSSYISQIERGLKNPSLEILRSLSRYLNVSPALLLESSNEPAKPFECVVIPKEARHRIQLDTNRDNVSFESLVPAQGAHGMRIFHYTIAPDTYVSGTQVTHISPEFAYVLSGSLDAYVGEEIHHVAEESSIYIAPMVPHEYHNSGQQAADVLFVLTD